jgi:hypothetical protein
MQDIDRRSGQSGLQGDVGWSVSYWSASVLSIEHGSCRDGQGRYRGDWRVDVASHSISGNPANAPVVLDLMKSLKHKNGANGGLRTHSVAMSFDHMKAIHTYLEENDLKDPLPDTVDTLHSKDKRIRALLFMAFSTLSWTLWTW